MAASADHVTDGRLVLGIGAGWQENEHTAYGLDYFTVEVVFAALKKPVRLFVDCYASSVLRSMGVSISLVMRRWSRNHCNLTCRS